MADILRPISDRNDPDRHIRCQDAVEHALSDVTDVANSVGWREPELAAAVIDLTDSHMPDRQATEDANALLALVRRMT